MAHGSTKALIIGVGSYDDPAIESLPAARTEAADVAGALTDPAGINLPAEHVRCLLDPSAAELVDALTAILDLADVADTVVMYFAGHAFRRDDNMFLAGRDAVLENLQATAVAATQLEQLLQTCRARGVLVILDCCVSAGFAEHTKGFFRRLQGAEFHLLLCASREDERSWEIGNGRGTLFTKHLLRVLRGETAAGSVPGAITFTGLLEAIDFGVNEDLATLHPNVPRQQPVAAAAFTRDPLLFEHPAARERGLTLTTDRVSRARFRRVLRRAGIGAVVALFVATFTVYTWIDHHLYARVNGRVIQVLRGHPRMNLPGYPRIEWEYALEEYLLERDSELRRGGVIVTGLDRPIEPLLLREMNPVGRATWAFREGDRTGARTIALQHLPLRNAIASEQDILLLHLFAEVAVATDLPRLRALMAHARTDVRQSAVRAILRLAPSEGIARLAVDLREGSGIDHGAVLDYLEPPCTTATAAYLSRAALVGPAHVDAPDVALRLGCGVDETALWFLIENRTTAADEVDELARFASAAQLPFRATLSNRQRAAADRPSTAVRWATFAAGLVPPECPRDVTRVWTNNGAFQWLRIESILAIGRGCGTARLRAEVPASIPRRIILRTDDPPLQLSLDGDRVSPGHFEELFGAIAERHLAEATPFVRALAAQHGENTVRAWALDTLGVLRQPAHITREMLFSTNTVLRRAAYTAWAREEPARAAAALLARIEEEGFDDFAETLARMPVPPLLHSSLTTALTGTDQAATRAAAVLAAHGDAAALVGLFRLPSRNVRVAAAEYVAANPRLDAALRIVTSAPGYPRDSIAMLRQAAAQRDELAAELARCPPWARAWRARNIAERRHTLIGRRRDLSHGHVIWLERQADVIS